MASLKEIKGRIASVRSTLKITSAMKLVSSAKLRKAQQAIANMLPYERQLRRLLVNTLAFGTLDVSAKPGGKIAILAFSSNSSLCGAFNSNVIRKTLSVIGEYRSAGIHDEDIIVYSIGRKMMEAMRKAGFPSPKDYSGMSESPDYESAAALAQALFSDFMSGRLSRVELVYNHYKSTASQPTIRETYLPMESSGGAPGAPVAAESSRGVVGSPRVAAAAPMGEAIVSEYPDDIFIEPSAGELLEALLPKVLRLKIYATLLDSSAAENAARVVAMQTATDNGEDLLDSLTLEYNKGRQQKITSEILDIVGGSLQ